MEKIILGLSGGVDSATAAFLLRSQGYEVIGVFLDIGLGSAPQAEKLASELGIEFESVDISQLLESMVCQPFIDAYLSGKTPNPCIICNPNVKFPALLASADRHGAKYIATGHYAVVEKDSASGLYCLLASPGDNDQSYMLSRLTQNILSRLKLPLGEFNKSEVRKIAASSGLSVADKPDSMEICFIPDGDYSAFIAKHRQVPPAGDFVDENGNILGRHKGIHHYTLGQRRGLGIAAGHRLFVSKIEPETNRVVLSDGDMLMTSEIIVDNLRWLSVTAPEDSIKADIKVRHSKICYPAKILPLSDNSARIIFDNPIRTPASGQTAAFYSGRLVLGSGLIA